jgi:hypothetical protein
MPAEPERLKILTRELVAHEDAIQCGHARAFVEKALFNLMALRRECLEKLKRLV